MRHGRAAGAAAGRWCICLPMCSLALKRARSMHTDALLLLCIPRCVCVFAVMSRGGIWFVLLVLGSPPVSIQVALFFGSRKWGVLIGGENLLNPHSLKDCF